MTKLNFSSKTHTYNISQERYDGSKEYLSYYDPMMLIFNFIRSEIIQKYDLLECFKYEDEEDKSTEFYIKLKNDLSFYEKNNLRSKIRKDIENYCFENNLIYINKFYIYLSR